ncbi:HvfC/BufC N-terminal domain-containing protein [Zavarzinia sp. CC-PAN008]|uniref:HvfC/BufC N-terminal domain-containing protein n=1 Tax=Zavarzinia sp. CC-PAN008 TaxID=3243332 RepID=UPI003F74237E
MTPLEELQHSFRAYLLDGRAGIAEHLAPGPRAGLDRTLRVYGYAYAARLVEVLGEDFPGLKLLAGDERFDRLARAYVAAHPSDNPSVRWFGRHLPDFLRSVEPWSGMPVLADMAAFEWAMGIAFDAADVTPATLADLGAIPAELWGDLRLDFHPSVAVLALGFDVAPFRRAAELGQDPDGPPQALDATWLFWRSELTVRYRQVESVEASLLSGALDGRTFGALCEDLAGLVGADDAPGLAVQALAGWLNAGLVVALRAQAE